MEYLILIEEDIVIVFVISGADIFLFIVIEIMEFYDFFQTVSNLLIFS